LQKGPLVEDASSPQVAMTAAIDHPAATHDTVARRRNTGRHNSRRRRAHRIRSRSPSRTRPQPPCHLASAVPGRAAVAAPTARTAAAIMTVVRGDVASLLLHANNKLNDEWLRLKLVDRNSWPAVSRGCSVPQGRRGSRWMGAATGVPISGPASLFWRRNSGPWH
jgi:hypothetical protein